MLRSPTADPNAVWTDITSRYLHIIRHPEISWWAIRGQLVQMPGYMVNCGLGSVLTADIREHTREALAPFETGNPQWYSWTSERLLRFGGRHCIAAPCLQPTGLTDALCRIRFHDPVPMQLQRRTDQAVQGGCPGSET